MLPALAMVNLAWAADSAGQTPLILAVHPYLAHDELISRFTPLADYIGRAIGRPVVVRIGQDYEDHVNAIGTDEVDIAYIGPAEYVNMVAKYGKKPLLARQEIDGQPYLKGEIIVRSNSPLQSLSALKGKRFVFTDASSTMGSLLPQYMLVKAGVPLSSLSGYKFLEGHENVALAVLAGDYDAGAVKEETFQKFAPKGLRSLAHLPLVYDHLFVASNKLPGGMVDTLRQLLLNLDKSAQGRAIMKSIHSGMTALVTPKDSEYDNLRVILGSKGLNKIH
ncbi:MAG: phosphate/phosphite/phosphonate ABC transporter substrate-binding protein [Gallionella sp.]